MDLWVLGSNVAARLHDAHDILPSTTMTSTGVENTAAGLCRMMFTCAMTTPSVTWEPRASGSPELHSSVYSRLTTGRE